MKNWKSLLLTIVGIATTIGGSLIDNAKQKEATRDLVREELNDILDELQKDGVITED